MRVLGIFSRTRANFWLIFHIWIVLDVIYNYFIGDQVEKFHLHLFWGNFSIWLQSIYVKNDFSQKVIKIDASNFPEMFIGSLSTTFVKTVRHFLHIDGSQIKKYVKKWVFFWYFLEKAWIFCAEILYWESVKNFGWYFMFRQFSTWPITFLSTPSSSNNIFIHFKAVFRFDWSQYALKMIFSEKFSKYVLQTFQKCSLDHCLQLF